MGEKTRCFELRTGEGQVVLSFNLVEKEVDLADNTKDSQTVNQGGNGDKKDKGPTNSGNNDTIMTEAQKRYLFRILAEHGVQGEIAHQELKNAFQVNFLTEVGKFEASQMIERLLGEGIGGLKNGPSIQ
jgi:hypothetical protein